MPRLHLTELEDHPWFPALVRDALTDYLQLATRIIGYKRAVAPILARVLRESGTRAVVDLCSGAGGLPVAVLRQVARTEGLSATLTLSDLYPNAASLARAAAHLPDGQGAVHPAPVDARAVPAELGGVRTMYNALHHFRPEDVREVLADAFRRRQPVAIFDGADRSLLFLAAAVAAPVGAALTVPFIGPPRLARMALTWPMPVIPAVVLWDGVVSCLRGYRPQELLALVADLQAPGWTWDAGSVEYPWLPGRINYITGVPHGRP